MEDAYPRGSGSGRRRLHAVAVVAMSLWGFLGVLVTALGALLVVTADPLATELDALPGGFGFLMLWSGPFSVVVAGLGVVALRAGRGRGRQVAVIRAVAMLAATWSVVVLVGLYSQGRGPFAQLLESLPITFVLWPYVVLPTAASTLVVLTTVEPDPFPPASRPPAVDEARPR